MSDKISEINKLLNSAQMEAVTYCDGPSVIVAGAGSGKTRVLTYKIAYLIEQGFPASSILALTFTNKAAGEMKERIMQIVGQSVARYLWTGTFHSVFLKILRQEVDAIGFLPDFTIYDTQDSKTLVKSIIKEMNLDEKVYSPSGVYNRISAMKNRLITTAAYRANQDWVKDDFHSGRQHFIDIFQAYCTRCKEANAMDFDDILVYTFTLFKNNKEVLEKYQKRFAFILVDEYQDTNIAQHQIINMLAGAHHRIAVVGDDAQSIYSFRGANIDNILYFQKSFEGCRIFKLEENYRSTQTIVDAANSLIEKNRFQIPKKVFSNLSKGDKIKVMSCFTDRNEAETVRDEIQKAVLGGNSYSDIVVLYRTNAQSRVFEDALRNSNIPYRIYGGLSFYSRKEIKDVLAYMRLVINHLDTESLRRIINYPARGIGEKSLSKLMSFAQSQKISPLNFIFDIDNLPNDFNAGTKGKLKKFVDIIGSLTEFYKTNDAYQTAEKIIIDSGIMGELSSNDDVENVSRRENVRELLSAIHEYCDQKRALGDENPSLSEFLAEVSLLTDQDTDTEAERDMVTLMTIHSAKGLEFGYVFVAGLEEELFPSSMCATEREIEEERRLLYVAITRAKERCLLSYAKTRFRWGNIIYCTPSRFLSDIDEQYLDMPPTFNHYDDDTFYVDNDNRRVFPSFVKSKTVFTITDKKVDMASLPSNFKPASQIHSNYGGSAKFDFVKGDRVEHSLFGRGTIMEIIGQGSDTKARVDFDASGQKTLLLKYSKLLIV
ncbi:MAG: 3'-5' exonuclease [Porphyromonadaceae bacterium]|nr:3'-5' exonuclease [Porphyromonadaceae bacterium]